MGKIPDGDTDSEKKRRGWRFWGGKKKKKNGKEASSSAKAAPLLSSGSASNASRTSDTSKNRSVPTSSVTTIPSKSILKKGPAGEAIKTSTVPSKSGSTDTLVKSENTLQSKSKPRLPSSWLTRSKRFRKWCEWAFELIDTDKTNSVDEKELYSGLLLIHLKLGTYAGPAACRPLGRERCHAVFQKMDLDGSGHLDFDEFQQVMSVLFGNILLRVLAQWSLTIMIVPLISQKVLDGIYWVILTVYHFIMSLDEYTTLDEAALLTLEGGAAWTARHIPGPVWQECVQTYTTLSGYWHVPEPLWEYYDKIGDVFAMIPESVWNTVPLTLMSTVLGILVVPWTIFKIDDFFGYLADRQSRSS